MVQSADDRIFATALDGIVRTSADGGHAFTSRQSADRVAYTGLVVNCKGAPLLLSRDGPKAQLP